MKKVLAGMLGLWFGLAISGQALAAEQHERGQGVTMSDLPKEVKGTFDKESKGGQVEELRKETLKDGRVVYWGEVIRNGKGSELEISDSGKVLHRGKKHDESMEKGEHQK